MKTKRRTFWSFFTRIGAGFLAFWLAVMAVFTVLLSQQRAKLMLAEMESKSDKLMGEDTDFLLDPSSYDTTDETELRRRLSKPVFMADSADPPNLQIIETAITDLKSGKVLQSNRWWLELIEGDNLYRVDMSGQPREVCEAVLAGAGTGESKIESLPKMTFEAWVDSVPGYRDDAYLKSITIEPTKSGTWEPTGEVRTIECAYDAEQVKGLTLKTMSCNRLVCPGPNGATTEQIAESLSSPARQALREWAEYPSRTNSSQTVEKLWLVRTYRRTIRYCPFAESGAVLVSYAAEGYPLKALLPVLIPVWAFSLVLALFCAAVLSGAQLRVWRKQERVERVRRETTAALAHELKTPLSVLSATAELLGDNLAPEKQGHYLEVIWVSFSSRRSGWTAVCGRCSNCRDWRPAQRLCGERRSLWQNWRRSACRRLCRPIPPSTPNLQHRANTRSMRTGCCSCGHWTLCSRTPCSIHPRAAASRCTSRTACSR